VHYTLSSLYSHHALTVLTPCTHCALIHSMHSLYSHHALSVLTPCTLSYALQVNGMDGSLADAFASFDSKNEGTRNEKK
jgi:hypothetical protein